jgi:hypothetical protein
MPRARGAGLQDEHRARVLANRLYLEHRWGRPCRAFNLCLQPGERATAELCRVQDAISAAEPALLRVPRRAMHISAAWLLPVHLEVPAAEKDELWARHAPDWLTILAEEITELGGLGLRYRDLVATDSAIIALAWPAGQVNELRARLAERLRIPLQLSAGDMVHTTLFRYGGPLNDPALLLAALADLDIQIEVRAAELLMVRERVFPALGLDVLHRFPIMM